VTLVVVAAAAAEVVAAAAAAEVAAAAAAVAAAAEAAAEAVVMAAAAEVGAPCRRVPPKMIHTPRKIVEVSDRERFSRENVLRNPVSSTPRFANFLR